MLAWLSRPADRASRRKRSTNPLSRAQPRREDLEGDDAVQLFLAGLEDAPHAALADLVDQLEAPQLARDLGRRLARRDGLVDEADRSLVEEAAAEQEIGGRRAAAQPLDIPERGQSLVGLFLSQVAAGYGEAREFLVLWRGHARTTPP